MKKYCKIHPSYRRKCDVCGCIIMKPKKLCDECKYDSNHKNRMKVYKWKEKEKLLVKAYIKLLKEDGCMICGYNKCDMGLHFHHIGNEKNKCISRCNTVSQIKREILNSNLVIICANCHSEVHFGLIKDDELVTHILTC